MKIAKLSILACAVVVALPACGRLTDVVSGREVVAFEGVQFRARVAAGEIDPEQFVVTVPNPARSMAGAQQAAQHEATAYCIERFGSSRMTLGAGAISANGDLTVAGACAGW